MATIKVRVQGEIATNLTPEVKLVCQNDKYDVEFEFDESWANSNFKTALFIYNGQLIAIPFDGTICKIPALYDTQLLHIGVKSNDIEGLHTSTPAKVVYLLSANDLTNNKIPEPSKDVYDEIIALLNKYISGGGSVDLNDYQKKVDENLPTTDKTIVGAIAEVKEIAETAKMVFGETEGTAYEGNKGKANADNIAKLQNKLSIVNVALEQSGLLKKYKQPITQEYTERVTADGVNVLDGSKAVLKKVVGNTVRCENFVDISKIQNISTTLENTGKTIRVIGDYSRAAGVSLKQLCPNLTSGKTYTFSAYKITTSNTYDRGGAVSIRNNPTNTSKSIIPNGLGLTKATVEITEEDLSLPVYFYGNNSGTTNDYVEFSQIMCVEGDYTNKELPPYQPYFTGLKSASFAGIESTNADGTETATLAFPKTETPLGTKIDFETKKITNYGVDLVLTGTEKWAMRGQNFNDVNQFYSLLLDDNKYKFGEGVCTDFDKLSVLTNKVGFAIGSMNAALYLSVDKTQITSVDDLKAWLAQRYADGNPVTIRYLSSTLQSETDFTADNEYTAYKGGTETVLENDGAEFGAENTLTQDYILVAEVG